LVALPDAIVLLTSGGIYGLRGRRFSKLAKFWLLFKTLAVVTNACGEFDIGGIPITVFNMTLQVTYIVFSVKILILRKISLNILTSF
jgi:hypothetical protein